MKTNENCFSWAVGWPMVGTWNFMLPIQTSAIVKIKSKLIKKNFHSIKVWLPSIGSVRKSSANFNSLQFMAIYIYEQERKTKTYFHSYYTFLFTRPTQ